MFFEYAARRVVVTVRDDDEVLAVEGFEREFAARGERVLRRQYREERVGVERVMLEAAPRLAGHEREVRRALLERRFERVGAALGYLYFYVRVVALEAFDYLRQPVRRDA